MIKTVNVTSQIVEIDYSREEGEVELHDTVVHVSSTSSGLDGKSTLS